MTLVYELLQYRIARLHNSVAMRTPGNGGAGQRAAVSLCRGHARPFRGTNGRAQPCHALDHAYGAEGYVRSTSNDHSGRGPQIRSALH
eukprot:6213768-Pleurochrysis_carterae.AAC.2